MVEYNEDSILGELEIFRWSLYNAKIENIKEEEKSLLDEACQKPIYEPFIEEWIIAGCDVTMLKDEPRIYMMEFVKGADLPSIRKKDHKYWNLNRLHICLAYGNEEIFIKGLELIAKKKPVELKHILANSDDLFCSAALNNFTLAIEKLVENHAIVNEVALLCACKSASWKSLEILLKYYDLGEDITPLLKELSNAWQNDTNANRENFDKCYELLLKRSDFNVNYVNQAGHSVMHYVRNQSDKVTECLKMGAYIGMQNAYSRPDVAFITPKTLQSHFDSCIQLIAQDTDNSKKNQYIEFDFKNLMPSEMCNDEAPNEMNAIEFMSDSYDHRYLLSHPLVWSFISLKWNQLALVYYIDFYLYLLFAIFNMGCILLALEKSPEYIKIPFIILTSILTAYVVMRSILHLAFCSSKHRQSLVNYMQCLQTLLIIIFVVWSISSEINHTIAAISILLIALKLFIFAGSIFWTFSKFYIMFLSVAWSSIKSLQLCIIFIPSFLMSYYLLIRVPSPKKDNPEPNLNNFKTEFFDYISELVHPGSKDVNSTILEEFKKNFFTLLPKILAETSVGETASNDFQQTVSSLVKTIMTWHDQIGEQITSFNLNAIGFIVVLITLLSITFMNLMNGLAVNDAKRIESEAELTSLVQRCHLLARYEEALSNRNHWFRRRWQGTFIMTLFEYFTQFESLENVRNIYNRKIYVGLKNEIIHFIDFEKVEEICTGKKQESDYKRNEKGDIKLTMETLFRSNNKNNVSAFSKANEIEMGLEEPFSFKNLFRAFPFLDEREKMDPQNVQLALQIIEKREVDQKDKAEQSQYKEQIAKLQHKLDTVENANSKILDKLMSIEKTIKRSVEY